LTLEPILGARAPGVVVMLGPEVPDGIRAAEFERDEVVLIDHAHRRLCADRRRAAAVCGLRATTI
jgi:hypothetical protein